MSHDCSICFEDLGCPQYDAACVADTDVSSSVFRLNCGHAYHTNCVVRALRSTRVCPMCRSDGTRTMEAHGEAEMIMAADGQIIIRMNAQDFLEEGEVESMEEVDIEAMRQGVQTIAEVRSASPRAQQARRGRNKALKRYSEHEGRLIVKRRQVICDALETFRHEERTSFERLRRQTQRDLHRFRAMELDALARRVGQTSATETWNRLGIDQAQYDINSRNGSRMGPLKHRFWTH